MAAKVKFKDGIRKATSTSYGMNKKVMNIKKSWDEVQRTLNAMIGKSKSEDKK